MWYTVCRVGEPRLCTAAVQSRDAAFLSHGGLSVAKLRTRAAGELQELQEGSGRGPRRHAAAGGGRRRRRSQRKRAAHWGSCVFKVFKCLKKLLLGAENPSIS